MITLDRLVNVLGGYGVRLRGRPATRSALLRSVAVADPTDARVAGDVLLAVGAASVTEAVRWAVSARASVVLVRAEPDAEPEPDARPPPRPSPPPTPSPPPPRPPP
ncbi:hypothetical protein [Thermocatellispora tengchongensis]|uniref:hypothetical protein n=1 Tax=Thermocatellispora tengchongensis TaxID=1073253 RepID=UPI00363964B0